MKKLLALLIAISLSESFRPAFGQSIIPKFIRKMYFEKDTTKRSSFVVLPVLSSAPETGIEAGGAALYSFYTDSIHSGTRVSNIYAYATLTTKGQNRLNLSTTYWSPQNQYHYYAAVGRIDFPVDFYGIGNNTHKADADRLGQKRYRLMLEAQKLIAKNVYAGFVGGGYKYDFISASPTGIFKNSPLVEDRAGGTFLYVGPSIIYDTRNNNTYTTSGMMINAYYNIMQGVLDNNSYHGGFLNVEYSQFISLGRTLVLGVDVQEQSLTGGRSPFYLLPQMGSDEMMRGYYEGRYRDRNLIAGQAELRYRLSERFGLVGFVGAGEVFHSAFALSALKPNLGAGLRYFFDIEKGLSLRADYGMGQKPAGEQRESGFYIGLGQAF
ncbi:BamA/TamA family outer membrane protein [Mucilaginibacter sp. UR6-11]|uniref:BamA/TamA family outer membrane protein n=1 Tax=Mucilaginibacter sp. UR6-11 TaxID=1435644 RepID=UPI001E34931F|nr:BamA/TamA family outer membrane protein [Mucilaginibacter sp. UR6-11]MCC8425187.1 outer membrane protein assembly factor [Mucilaginibacter sp. UR6-11]